MIKKRICPNCKSQNTIKKGIQNGKQTYKCKDCKKWWNTENRINKHHDIWNEYVFHKQTVNEIYLRTHISEKTIRKYIKDYVVLKKEDHNPREIFLCIDTTYFGKKIDDSSWGLMLFRDGLKKENLWWKYVDNETKYDYEEGRRFLEMKGYKIMSVTFDGFRGNINVWKDIPRQICLFHMIKMIKNGVTNRPKTEAGKVILALGNTLLDTDKETFTNRVRAYYEIYEGFLNEKTIHPDGKSSFTHEGVRSAYNSICNWFEFLFTYMTDKRIPTTTNTCEGHFSHIKKVMKIHRSNTITLDLFQNPHNS